MSALDVVVDVDLRDEPAGVCHCLAVGGAHIHGVDVSRLDAGRTVRGHRDKADIAVVSVLDARRLRVSVFVVRAAAVDFNSSSHRGLIEVWNRQFYPCIMGASR